jgi:hypothetical protein
MNGNTNGTSQTVPTVKNPEEDINKELMARKAPWSKPDKTRGTS